MHTLTQHSAMPFTCLICNQTSGKRLRVHVSPSNSDQPTQTIAVGPGLSESDKANHQNAIFTTVQVLHQLLHLHTLSLVNKTFCQDIMILNCHRLFGYFYTLYSDNKL